MQIKKNDAQKQDLYKGIGSLSVMPSLLPHVLWRRSQVSLFLSPDVMS